MHVERIQVEDLQINIFYDEDGRDPREWGDPVARMVCKHGRYSLPCDVDFVPWDEFSSWAEVEEWLYMEHNAAIIAPIHMLDHSGVWLRMGSGFGDCDPGYWDSGQVGFIFMSRLDLEREYGEDITPEIIHQALNDMRGEVEVYGHYLNGEVYSYEITGKWVDDDENVGPGFYGLEDVEEVAREEAERYLKNKRAFEKRTLEALNAWPLVLP